MCIRDSAYTDCTSNEVHLVLAKGEIRPDRETLVRVHEPLSLSLIHI